MAGGGPLPGHVLLDGLRHELAVVVSVALDVVHALAPDGLVELLVAQQLVGHRSEEARAVLPHRLDRVPLPPHHTLEPAWGVSRFRAGDLFLFLFF